MSDIFDDQIPNTSEAVNDRIGAACIDYLIFAIVFILCVFIFGKKTGEHEYRVTGPPAVIPIIFWFLYFIVFEFFFQGSFGKKLCKLKVISITGDNAKFIQIVIRRFCDLLDIIWCFGIMGVVLIRKTVHNQRLGDIWAKTIVVKRQIR